jgi:hypothetical protein
MILGQMVALILLIKYDIFYFINAIFVSYDCSTIWKLYWEGLITYPDTICPELCSLDLN